MYEYTITKSTTGCAIYVNLINSPAGKYLSRQPYVLALVKEAVDGLQPYDTEMTLERDLGRTIGHTDIVTTDEADSVFYAQPIKNAVFSRFVKNRAMPPSQKLTIILKQDEAGNYEIVNTWIGPLCPPFPGDEQATDTSLEYWQTHALVADSQAIQAKSITKVCPY